jgi:hypothetical protein
MDIKSAEHLMRIYGGRETHKAILWDSYDGGETVTLHIMDRHVPSRSVINALNLNEWELGDLIFRLTRLRGDLKELKELMSNGKDKEPG